MAGYSGKPLGDKLGLKSGMKVYFKGLPDDVRNELESYLTKVETSNSLKGSFDYLHVFTKEAKDLQNQFSKLVDHLADKGMIWISWPKGSSKIATDVTENVVREIGLKLGIVDVKVCAVSEIWSGLKFYKRKT
ncbi:DUF3052 family protein [Leptospira stimsonii]|uniref:DUF3052 domain-containing protein n=1 Tax=Leptospira stimsonii TaxID=2202203 RepID=A0A396ZGD1_9LEPT|nr:DUF3052 family protein [Leptospira stimsonii]RHX92548.1 DUF3052 domain-containing protein [Leptospira stimsonii]